MNKKIRELEDLGRLTESLRKEGKTIAHCHGCFDLMHPGHIKHFEAAKAAADILIVTITPDRFVNKGPGRPVFNERIRMEAITALQCVDYVSLNKWETAVETIKIIKPHLYVKGQDYKDRSKDITKGIYKEEEAVKSVGGTLFITEEIQFSSSALINAHMSPYDENVNLYRENFKDSHSAETIIETITSLSDLKVLVLGDTIIDEYHYATPLGKSSKSPTISSKFVEGNTYAGGILAIANHINQFAGTVELFTVLGKGDSNEKLIEERLTPGISKNFFYRDDSPTPTKRRYLDKYLNIKLFEVTFMNDHYLEKELEDQLIEAIQNKLPEVDLIVLADFGHGMITPRIIKFLEDSGKFLCVNAQTNSNNYGYNYITKYNRADFISIDENELRLPFGEKFGELEVLINRLSAISHCSNIQVTLGQKGSILFQNNNFNFAPALAMAVKDSVGAGDAVLSLTSLLAFKNAPPEVISFVGNCVGSLAVEIIGNEHPVYKKDLLKFINHFLK
ncbi:MAG TPA: hypothetical protein DIW47_04240 [Bacteroidetes bacterium]|nr:hypothetical protein [Bacteroidota bacterium]